MSIRNITLIAIAFHLIWGAIFGFIISSLLRIRLFRIKEHYKDDVLSSSSRFRELAYPRREQKNHLRWL
ncbi:MAG: hypothetical protein WBP64_06130 [Nitrososphaeraceae archaeon]